MPINGHAGFAARPTGTVRYLALGDSISIDKYPASAAAPSRSSRGGSARS
jgi:hypothetical protein